jgi:hypothetical protein
MSAAFGLLAARVAEGLAALPEGALPAAAVAAFFALALVLGARRRRGPNFKAPAAAASRPAPRGAARAWTARALAQGGADITEVARRTGLAREAVHLALRTTRAAGRGPA